MSGIRRGEIYYIAYAGETVGSERKPEDQQS